MVVSLEPTPGASKRQLQTPLIRPVLISDLTEHVEDSSATQ
jgi:hypothetical protein